ncbi:MAG TPA: PQ-loop domain-containing transporter [Propionibacteriaceae bacterium]|nr:PQ-loop domain-containing transporter [Propionibacteriaceae bacterium]
MPAVDVVGWLATLVGISLGLPQALRLVRTRQVEGLSLTAWQAWLVLNLSYTAHGISIGQPPQVLTSALSLCSTVPILFLMARGLRRRVVPVLLPGLLGAAALITIDQLLGPAVFGTLAVIPAVTANAGQSIELVRSRRVVGVSVLFLILAVTNQGLWLSWAMLVPDIGTITVAAVTGTITVFNLTWWSLRTLGLRSFRLPLPKLTGTAAPGEALQPAGGAPPRSDDRGHC